MSCIKNFIRRRYAWSGRRSIIIGVRIPVSWRSCRVEVLRGGWWLNTFVDKITLNTSKEIVGGAVALLLERTTGLSETRWSASIVLWWNSWWNSLKLSDSAGILWSILRQGNQCYFERRRGTNLQTLKRLPAPFLFKLDFYPHKLLRK